MAVVPARKSASMIFVRAAELVYPTTTVCLHRFVKAEPVRAAEAAPTIMFVPVRKNASMVFVRAAEIARATLIACLHRLVKAEPVPAVEAVPAAEVAPAHKLVLMILAKAAEVAQPTVIACRLRLVRTKRVRVEEAVTLTRIVPAAKAVSTEHVRVVTPVQVIATAHSKTVSIKPARAAELAIPMRNVPLPAKFVMVLANALVAARVPRTLIVRLQAKLALQEFVKVVELVTLIHNVPTDRFVPAGSVQAVKD